MTPESTKKTGIALTPCLSLPQSSQSQADGHIWKREIGVCPLLISLLLPHSNRRRASLRAVDSQPGNWLDILDLVGVEEVRWDKGGKVRAGH